MSFLELNKLMIKDCFTFGWQLKHVTRLIYATCHRFSVLSFVKQMRVKNVIYP